MYKIKDLAKLQEIIESRSFVNQALVLTCLSMLLEVFGQVFISLGSSFGYLVYFLQPKFIMLMVHMTQWSDVGGFMFGNIYGKTSFAKTISPKKTFEGVAGAIFLPTFVMCLFYGIGQLSDGKYALKMPLLDYLFLGIVCSCLSILGDLIESFLKRCGNRKDSGSLLPEHGGILDRIDSMLLVLPFLYWYVLEYLDFTHSENYDFDNVHIL